MKPNLQFAFAILSAAALIGCSEDSKKPNSPVESNYLFPIVQQKVWIYDAERRTDDSLTYRAIDTVEVDTTYIVWGGEVWNHYINDPDFYWRNGIDGVWRLRFDDGYDFGRAEKIYGYPARAGQGWIVPTDDDSVWVISNSETVTVPAGSFGSCYYYGVQRSGGSRRGSVWICPGVGIVQESIVTFAGADTLTSTRQLRAY